MAARRITRPPRDAKFVLSSSASHIVRIEVRPVKSKLEAYYAEDGASDPVLITIPKGTYVPVFQQRDSTETDMSGRAIRTMTSSAVNAPTDGRRHMRRTAAALYNGNSAYEDARSETRGNDRTW
jgi:hypothetical protein